MKLNRHSFAEAVALVFAAWLGGTLLSLVAVMYVFPSPQQWEQVCRARGGSVVLFGSKQRRVCILTSSVVMM